MKNEGYYVDKNPNWLNWIAPEKFNDKDLFKIVVFFVFHSPCNGLSARQISLSDYGWKTPWKKPYSLKKRLKESASNYNLLYSAQKYDGMETALKKADLLDGFPKDITRERVCFYNGQRNQFMSVFYHLRNAFAHCRLNLVDIDGECYFVMEDVLPNKNGDKVKLSARMILKKSTLLKWIDLIKDGGEK